MKLEVEGPVRQRPLTRLLYTLQLVYGRITCPYNMKLGVEGPESQRPLPHLLYMLNLVCERMTRLVYETRGRRSRKPASSTHSLQEWHIVYKRMTHLQYEAPGRRSQKSASSYTLAAVPTISSHNHYITYDMTASVLLHTCWLIWREQTMGLTRAMIELTRAVIELTRATRNNWIDESNDGWECWPELYLVNNKISSINNELVDLTQLTLLELGSNRLRKVWLYVLYIYYMYITTSLSIYLNSLYSKWVL